MTKVRIAHAEPWPGWLPEARFVISHFLVVLADDAGGRALPVWLEGTDGDPLWRILDQPAREAGMAGTAEELAGRLLQAEGVAVTGVDIDEMDADVIAAPRRQAPGSPPGRPSPPARIALGTARGTRHMTARLGFCLALAAAAGAPVRVAGGVLDRLAAPVDGDLLGPFLEGLPVPGGPRGGRRWRFEPRNLTFADGLDWWEFGGSFRRDAGESHGDDYACTVGDRSVTIRSAVPEPYGFAALRQTIAADDYRDRAVVFGAEVRTDDVAGQAGLHLMTGPPLGPREGPATSPSRTTATVSGSRDWTRHEVRAQVPGDAGILAFGFFLSGRGRVELRGAELTCGG